MARLVLGAPWESWCFFRVKDQKVWFFLNRTNKQKPNPTGAAVILTNESGAEGRQEIED